VAGVADGLALIAALGATGLAVAGDGRLVPAPGLESYLDD
jgi:hypothetical protein